jgi:hypothetical protein
MNTNDICTEEQAIALAGVSARTLQRFCESGYLTATTSALGEVYYLRSQLTQIFGSLETESDLVEEDCLSEGVSPLEQPATLSDEKSSCIPSDDSADEDSRPHAYTSTSSTGQTKDRSSPRAEIEVERLKNLLAIQERMLDSKDDEIADLKNQRAWLRQRIEKLEEKHDRDQILLLSETQTIRSLIAYQESRKSTFRQLLEWIGVAQSSSYTALPQPHTQSASNAGTGRTIEVRQAANQE